VPGAQALYAHSSSEEVDELYVAEGTANDLECAHANSTHMEKE
jgi:hypothetical protein